MADPNGEPDNGESANGESANGESDNGTRILAVVAAIAAVAAFAVAIGLVLSTDDDTADAPAPTTTNTPALAPTVTVSRNPVFSAPNTSPMPTQPAHRVGDGCDIGNVTGRWDVVTGRGWVCVPVVPSTAPPLGER
ncbi:hypothetical protein [Nocardia bovistercoris]|uniref:Uncharacterized protein n=1 Tax=Nocardia bovistercoris TaxID=2785916 RepID=A0A931N056_9NOCA|nr:hypothetical protein [Nocardia bovistercoris]MBH0776885.1 hypothetical protein [Nocardia bovistercoris]